jgi:hypothetical protein
MPAMSQVKPEATLRHGLGQSRKEHVGSFQGSYDLIDD